MCFVFIWEQTATCATYSINWLVFITEMKSVYSAVRTGSLNKVACASSLKGQYGLNFSSLLVTWCTTSLTFNNYTFCPHCIYVFCIYLKQTATCATYIINWLVFITEKKSFYCAVRTGYLNKVACASSLKGQYCLNFSSLLVTWCTNSLTFNNCKLCPHCIYVFCIYLRTATCATYSINWLVFMTEMKSVYSAVRTGSLNKAYWLRDAPTV